MIIALYLSDSFILFSNDKDLLTDVNKSHFFRFETFFVREIFHICMEL